MSYFRAARILLVRDRAGDRHILRPAPALATCARRRSVPSALVAWADWPGDAAGVATEVIWSPYYQVRFKPRTCRSTSTTSATKGCSRSTGTGAAYMLPHLLNRDAGESRSKMSDHRRRSGNDVAAALGEGVGHVDAVEIDPVLNEIGRRHHPNQPYSDPRVTIHLDDGRSFLRTTGRRYDLIIYALVDSLVLHSRLFEPAARELPVHRAGVPRHQGQAQARRRVRHVQLVPAGLDVGRLGKDGRDGLW